MPTRPDILVLFAHLAIGHSKINRAMLEALEGLERVRVHDLLETYPDFYIDVEREQALLREVDLVVFQHPVYWYGLPAIMKHWLDCVFTQGFVFGEGGDALHGKALLQACSTGAQAEAYAPGGIHHYPISQLLLPMKAVARFCGMRYLEPLVLHGGHRLPEAVIQQHAKRYRETLATYRHAPEPQPDAGVA